MNRKTDIETLIEEALEILDHAELEMIEGGVVWGPSCPSYPSDDDWLNGSSYHIPPIILC